MYNGLALPSLDFLCWTQDLCYKKKKKKKEWETLTCHLTSQKHGFLLTKKIKIGANSRQCESPIQTAAYPPFTKGIYISTFESIGSVSYVGH